MVLRHVPSLRGAAARDAWNADAAARASQGEAAVAWGWLRALRSAPRAARPAVFRAALAAFARAEALGRVAAAQAARPLPHPRLARLDVPWDDAGLPGASEALVAASEASRQRLSAWTGGSPPAAPALDADAQALAAALPSPARRAARWRRASAALQTGASGIGVVVSAVILGLVWVVAAPLLALPSRARLRRTRSAP